ncbi:transporter substrate-binding domain-containing protein [Ramlibacter sp. AN1015]|uniref:transporter substrate-binding domain-containing protein n=1 Tax=Ramlibacter sp. AN1015 TaxID=3133428 RepID=UPI0030BB7AA8
MRPLHVLLALAFMALAPLSRADALDDIQRRGRLVVGVKQDVPLWGWTDPRTGVPVGLEPDLAADLAQRLSVRLELVGVLTSERLDALERGRIDVLIATLSDTLERRRQAALVEPHYYASGANVMARRTLALRSWSDLRDRRVCGRRGAFYNRAVTVEHGIDIVALYSNTLALAALRDGRCDAVLYDDTNILAMLQDTAWGRDFEMPLPSQHVMPWSIALHRDEAGGRLAAMVSQAVVDWHRSGELARLERKWGIPVSAFTRRMNALWSRRDKGGAWHCGASVGPTTPKECL